jgi:hypothetical protein
MVGVHPVDGWTLTFSCSRENAGVGLIVRIETEIFNFQTFQNRDESKHTSIIHQRFKMNK